MFKPLEEKAKAVINNSYSPYSQFKVAAVVEDNEGRLHSGVNVENASFGLTLCAERNAIVKAISEGAREITRVLIYTPTEEPVAPCGACRQVIREFSDQARIVAICDSDARLDTNLATLLPDSFGPDNLD